MTEPCSRAPREQVESPAPEIHGPPRLPLRGLPLHPEEVPVDEPRVSEVPAVEGATAARIDHRHLRGQPAGARALDEGLEQGRRLRRGAAGEEQHVRGVGAAGSGELPQARDLRGSGLDPCAGAGEGAGEGPAGRRRGAHQEHPPTAEHRTRAEQGVQDANPGAQVRVGLHVVEGVVFREAEEMGPVGGHPGPRPVVEVASPDPQDGQKDGRLERDGGHDETRRKREEQEGAEAELRQVLRDDVAEEVRTPPLLVDPELAIEKAVVHPVEPAHGLQEPHPGSHHAVEDRVDDVEGHGRGQEDRERARCNTDPRHGANIAGHPGDRNRPASPATRDAPAGPHRPRGGPIAGPPALSERKGAPPAAARDPRDGIRPPGRPAGRSP